MTEEEEEGEWEDSVQQEEARHMGNRDLQVQRTKASM